MTKYKCGHECDITILDNNELSFMAWYDWSQTVGVFGSKEKCWECYCKRDEKPKTKKKRVS